MESQPLANENENFIIISFEPKFCLNDIEIVAGHFNLKD